MKTHYLISSFIMLLIMYAGVSGCNESTKKIASIRILSWDGLTIGDESWNVTIGVSSKIDHIEVTPLLIEKSPVFGYRLSESIIIRDNAFFVEGKEIPLSENWNVVWFKNKDKNGFEIRDVGFYYSKILLGESIEIDQADFSRVARSKVQEMLTTCCAPN